MAIRDLTRREFMALGAELAAIAGIYSMVPRTSIAADRGDALNPNLLSPSLLHSLEDDEILGGRALQIMALTYWHGSDAVAAQVAELRAELRAAQAERGRGERGRLEALEQPARRREDQAIRELDRGFRVREL